MYIRLSTPITSPFLAHLSSNVRKDIRCWEMRPRWQAAAATRWLCREITPNAGIPVMLRIFINLKVLNIWPQLLFYFCLFSSLSLHGTKIEPRASQPACCLFSVDFRHWLSWPGQPHIWVPHASVSHTAGIADVASTQQFVLNHCKMAGLCPFLSVCVSFGEREFSYTAWFRGTKLELCRPIPSPVVLVLQHLFSARPSLSSLTGTRAIDIIL